MSNKFWAKVTSVLLVAALAVTAGCASSEPEKRDYPAETVGGPPSDGPTGGGARARSLSGLEQEDFPSDECEKIYRDDRRAGTRCFHELLIDRVRAGDPSSGAAFWPEAIVRIQVTGSDGKTEVIEIDGAETARRLRRTLESGATSGIVRIAAEEERARRWDIEPLSDGTVRLHQEEREEAGSWKADYYVAMVDDELKYVRLVVIMYVDSSATLR